ncbi:MAG TPA: hypothetical protein VHT25_09300 [Solirubrobacteraceae bacterium]|nr:hypothetical protein [Solirubrobacteraceae bacterium]
MSPIVTAGLPAPGLPLDELSLELDDVLLLLPQAAKPMLSATTANSADALPPTIFHLLLRVSGIYTPASCY